MIERAERLRAELQIDFIAREAEIAEHQFVAGKTGVGHGFQPTIVLHPIGERVADDADVFALLEFQRGRVSRGRGQGREESKSHTCHGRGP